MTAATGAWRAEQLEGESDTLAGGLTFEQFYNACLPQIYRFVYFYVQDRLTAEDLASETFVKAWRHWPPESARDGLPKAWVFRIARNTVNDYYRALKRKPSVSLEWEEEESADPQADPAGNHDRLDLAIALSALSEPEREVISLRLAGLTNREIAALVERSEGAVEMTCYRALHRLQKQLADTLGPPLP